jgi:hypothetical protein
MITLKYALHSTSSSNVGLARHKLKAAMFKNHIEWLKFKISEMEVKSLETEARLKASEKRLVDQRTAHY